MKFLLALAITILLSHEYSSKEINNNLFKNDVSINLNKPIDLILQFVHGAFIRDREVTIHLPDQNKKIGKPPYNGTFQATSGYFTNPASLHRTGDTLIVKKGSTVGLKVALGLSEMKAGYKNYKLDILGIHQAGQLDISIQKNSLTMSIVLTYLPKCEVKLEYLKFDELSGIQVNATNLGVFKNMFEQLSKWFIAQFESNIKTIINKTLDKKVRKVLSKNDLCKYFPN
ncbi:uncharacterized protein LOC106666809 [Cimex lectularius]|uniref:Uncharacterized protein n=1 Tax=Cimex lectularius TaxID=79782 RepID=A0A8I6RTA2_CIMLE|nr:uncharacterized protein LOC106666809 [Cimex lectularius]